MLLLLLLLHNVHSRDIPKQSSHVTKLVKPCPDVGYFFKREQANELPSTCFLCFCKDDNTAICWPRDNKRCDEKSYRHYRQRDARRRRSLPGDDLLVEHNSQIAGHGKSHGKLCKPQESSFSEGCPPDDWCKGCTVCDCNKDGRWACHILSFCPENDSPKKRKNGRKMYRMKGVTKVNPTQAVNIDKPKRPQSKLSPKERIIRREATRKMKKSNRRKQEILHPAATPRGQTYKTTLRSRHRGRNPAAMRRLAENMKAQILDLIADKSTERQTEQLRITKNSKGQTPNKKTQTRKNSQPKQKTSYKKETQSQGGHSNSKTTLKNSKTIASTKKLILQTTPTTKTVGISKITKSISSSMNRKITKSNVLTTNKQTINVVPTRSNNTDANKTPVVKIARNHLEKNSTAIAETVMDKMLNQQILTASANTQDAKVNKRSLVKRVNVAKNKQLKQVHADKTKNKQVKTVPIQKRSKINVEKSNKVKVNKRHKRNINIWSTSDKGLYNGTILIESAFPQNIPQDFKDTTVESTPSSTELPIEYYRYTIDNMNKSTGVVARTDFTRVIPLNLKNNTLLKAFDMEREFLNLTVLHLKTDNTFVTPSILMDAENFTISNWSRIFFNNEILPTTELAVKYTRIKTTTNISKSSNSNSSLVPEQILLSPTTNTMFKGRTIVTVPKKHKIKKVVSTLTNKSMRLEDFNQTRKNNRSLSRNTADFDGFKHFMHNILTGFHQNNKTRTRSKKNKFKIIKYLKKFFKRLFSKMKNKGREHNKTELPELNKKSVIETLCETFGPCNINFKNKERLERDIHALNAETYKMLRSIKIIKGLLKLLDFAKNDKNLPDMKNVTTKTAFKHDIHKLHSILRGTYIKDENLDKLTVTQKYQLDYVKNNTHSFIKSATRFALILNDIINIVNAVNTSYVAYNNLQRSMVNDTVYKDFSKMNNNKVENNSIRVLRVALGNETIKTGQVYVHNKTHGDPFKKMKNLITKYNLLQNTFMKKIYKLIASFDEVDVKEINKVVGRTAIKALNVSDDGLTNRTEAIHIYTKNIIKNLRKLKDLAQRLTFTNRKKRELKDDDSLEYLLMLMEYLLKQKHPLDIAPANDGIDLIIDAIRQAPDIKPIVKKVLDITTTESSRIRVLTEVNSSESMSDIKFSKEDIKFSKEDIKFSKEDNSSSQAEEFKLGYQRFNLNEPSIDDEEEEEDAFVLNKRDKILSSTTEIEYYLKDDHPTPAVEALIERLPSPSTPILPKELTPSIVFATSGEIVRQVDFEKDEKKDIGLKFDVFDGEIEEEVPGSSSTAFPDMTEVNLELTGDSTPIFDSQSSSTPNSKEKEDPVVFRRIFRDNEIRNVRVDNSEPADVSTSQSKSKLDWLEESYEEEVKIETKGETRGNQTESSNRAAETNAGTPVEIGQRRKMNGSENISNISRDEEAKRKKQSAEDLIYKKEMDLLNSLDYGTGEKSEKEGSNSKESNEDKYAADAFEGYFV